MAVNVEQLYRKYGPMVLRRCRFLLRNEEEACDAMQEVFVRVLRKERELHDTAPSSLLYRIATNVCLNVIRKLKKTPPCSGDTTIDQLAGWDDPERHILAGDFLDRLFDRHKESTRAIAVYHYVDDFTLEETAALVGLSVSGVRKRLRALRESGLALKEV